MRNRFRVSLSEPGCVLTRTQDACDADNKT